MPAQMTLSRETFAKAVRARHPSLSNADLTRFADQAFSTHENIRVPDAKDFAAAVGDRLDENPLDALHAADLFLALGSVRGDASALAAFARLCKQRIPKVLSSMRPSPALLEEVEERLQEKLVVAAKGKAPRLAEYQGTGSLASWVGVAAVRIAIELVRLKRYQQGQSVDEPGFDAAVAASDPELDLLQATHSKRFKVAFQTSFMKLPIEDRSLLRLNLKDGLSIDQLGVMFQIHRATAARRITKAGDAARGRAHRARGEVPDDRSRDRQ